MAVFPTAYRGLRFCPNQRIHADQLRVGLQPEITLQLCCAVFIADCSRDIVCFTFLYVCFIFLHSTRAC
jgi:hypothetical protein